MNEKTPQEETLFWSGIVALCSGFAVLSGAWLIPFAVGLGLVVASTLVVKK